MSLFRECCGSIYVRREAMAETRSCRRRAWIIENSLLILLSTWSGKYQKIAKTIAKSPTQKTVESKRTTGPGEAPSAHLSCWMQCVPSVQTYQPSQGYFPTAQGIEYLERYRRPIRYWLARNRYWLAALPPSARLVSRAGDGSQSVLARTSRCTRSDISAFTGLLPNCSRHSLQR